MCWSCAMSLCRGDIKHGCHCQSWITRCHWLRGPGDSGLLPPACCLSSLCCHITPCLLSASPLLSWLCFGWLFDLIPHGEG